MRHKGKTICVRFPHDLYGDMGDVITFTGHRSISEMVRAMCADRVRAIKEAQRRPLRQQTDGEYIRDMFDDYSTAESRRKRKTK